MKTKLKSIGPLEDSHSHLCGPSPENQQYKLAQVLWLSSALSEALIFQEDPLEINHES
jgi:hypothetical protein